MLSVLSEVDCADDAKEVGNDDEDGAVSEDVDVDDGDGDGDGSEVKTVCKDYKLFANSMYKAWTPYMVHGQ